MQADKSTSRTPTSPRKPQRSLWGYMKKSTFKNKEATPTSRWGKQSNSEKTNQRFIFSQDLTRKNRFENTIIEYLTEEKRSLADTVVHPKA
jgi:hypothetical protein